MLQSSIDELDALAAELSAVKARLETRGDDGVALWEAETTLRHLGDRARQRADVLKAVIRQLDGPHSNTGKNS